jgi:polyferredoxin
MQQPVRGQVGHILRPRVVIYSTILGVIVAGFIWGLATKSTLKVDVIRDRATLAREVDDGLIENVYRLQIMNVRETPGHFSLAVSGLNQISLVGDSIVDVPPAAMIAVSVSVRVPPEAGRKGSNTIYFDVKSLSDDGASVHEKATFLVP